MKKNRNNRNTRSLNLNKKSVSRLNEEAVNGGRAASNISANLYQCLSDATHCADCNKER